MVGGGRSAVRQHHRTIRRTGVAHGGLGHGGPAGDGQEHRRDERKKGGPVAQLRFLSAPKMRLRCLRSKRAHGNHIDAGGASVPNQATNPSTASPAVVSTATLRLSATRAKRASVSEPRPRASAGVSL